MNDVPKADSPVPSPPRRAKSSLQLSLRPAWKGVILLAAVSALGAWASYHTVRIALASAPLDSISIPEVKAGLAYEPSNPALLHQVGLLYASSPTDLDLNEARKDLQQAVSATPRRWDYWADLASACDTMGDTACADAAFEKSRALNIHFPHLTWTIANHYVLTDRLDKAFPYFRQLLQDQPGYQGPVFRLCLRAAGDPKVVYEQVVPQGPDPTPRFAFLHFLCVSGATDTAMQVWDKMINGPDHALDAASARGFLDFLIGHNKVHEAQTVWNDLTHMGSVPLDQNPDPRNLFYNASFERTPLNMGFDWRYSEGEDLLYDFTDNSVGGHCVRIEFPVARDLDYDLLGQLVVVKPNTKYQLTAQIRSEGLTSNSGPRLKVVYWGCPDCPVRTSDPTLGTTHWHPVDVSFITPPGIEAVRVSLWRPQGRLGARDMSGTLWVDQFKLQPMPPTHSPAIRDREQ